MRLVNINKSRNVVLSNTDLEIALKKLSKHNNMAMKWRDKIIAHSVNKYGYFK